MEAEGEIFLLSTSTDIVAGDTLYFTLAANASAESMREIPVASRSDVTLALKFIGLNPRTTPPSKFMLIVPKALITPDGETPFITEKDILKVGFSWTALKKDADTPLATLYPLPPGGVT
jgi:hypothetical protein